MTSLLKSIQPKSDQLNFDDFIGGKTLTIKVTKVKVDAGDQPVAIYYEGDNGKPYKPGKSMRRVLVNIWGVDSHQYVGRSMVIFGDPKVMFGGIAVGGIRISHMSHLDKEITMALTATRASRKPFVVKPMTMQTQDGVDPAIIDAGNLASMSGVASYTAWLAALSPEVKAIVRGHHNSWSKVAKEADDSNKGETSDNQISKE